MALSQGSIMRQRSHYRTVSYGTLVAILPVIVGKRRDRFLSKIGEPSGPKGCREWQGGQMPAGYGLVQGSIAYQGYTFLAHRVSWALAHDCEPGELVIRHWCDNPPCCEWRHLRSGTDLDNVRDMIERGRLNPHGPGVDTIARSAAIRMRFQDRMRVDVIAATLGRHRSTISRWLAWHLEQLKAS